MKQSDIYSTLETVLSRCNRKDFDNAKPMGILIDELLTMETVEDHSNYKDLLLWIIGNVAKAESELIKWFNKPDNKTYATIEEFEESLTPAVMTKIRAEQIAKMKVSRE